MKKFILLGMSLLMLAGCGQKGDKGDAGIPGAPAPTPAPTPTPTVDVIQEDIDALVKDENDYRLGLGQTALTVGLSCSVVQVASGQWLSTSSPGYPGSGVIVTTGSTYSYLYKGSFTQPDSAGSDPILLLPPSIRPMFIGKNFKISCSGYIVVRETNYYDFSLNSDDGSILTIDGGQVVNNDNNHGMTLKNGTKFLRRGVRSFNIQYAQTGGGNFGLILQAGGASIEGKYYAH
jgi:hypothetical protein